MENPLIPPPANARSSLYVQSLATGLTVLRAFSAEHPCMSLPEIAAATGISKSAAQRFAYTLEALGFLKKDPQSKRYSLSSLNLEPGYQYLQCHPVLERANPYLLDLNQRSGETVNLAEPSGDCMVYIGRFSSLVRLIMHMPVGQRIPMYCSSTGHMYLSQFSDEEVHAFLSGMQRVRYTPQTETELETLCLLVQKTRLNGYGCCVDQYYAGDLAMSVPVTDSSGATIACINLSVSSLKWTREQAIEKFVPMMQATARLISTTPPHPSTQRVFKAVVQPRVRRPA